MRFNRSYTMVLLLILLLMALTGCFQQAGESFQPVDTGSESLPLVTPTPLDNTSGGLTPVQESPIPFDATTSSEGVQSEQPTPEVAITVFSPTREQPSTDTPELIPTQESLSSGFTTATESQFVTPFSPLGPIATDTLAAGVLPAEGGATATPSGLITPTALPGADNAANCTHTVQPGETLFRIAINNHTTTAELQTANPQIGNINLIHPGDVLNIPNCNGSTTSVQPQATENATQPVNGDIYVVKHGDTLFAIAQRFGVTMKSIQDANNIPDPNRLSPGQQLVIPPPSG
jgi:LysM repeat protein